MRKKQLKPGSGFTIILSKSVESEIIDWLNEQENLSKSINRLITKEVLGENTIENLQGEIEKIKLELNKLKEIKENTCKKTTQVTELKISDSEIVNYPEEEELF